MNGTWKVTSYGTGPVILAVVAGCAAVEGAEWVLARIFWILGTGLLFMVALAVILGWLMRWTARRDAVRVPLWRDTGAPPAQLYAEPVTELPRTERPAIAPAVINLNFYGVPAAERATIIRTAIEGNGPS